MEAHLTILKTTTEKVPLHWENDRQVDQKVTEEILEMDFKGDARIYSKILKELEEVAVSEKWVIE